MKKITEKEIKSIEAGTELFDTVDKKMVKVTSVNKRNYFIIDYGIIETKESLKRIYMI